MKQIVDKLNDIAKAIDENVELPTSDLIVDSLDAITRAYGGTPNDSNLIVDKLEAIAGVAHSGGGGEVEKHYVITEGSYTSTILGDISGVYLPTTYFFAPEIVFNIDGVEHILNGMAAYSSDRDVHVVYREEDDAEAVLMLVIPSFMSMSGTFIPTTDTEPTAHTISAYYVGEKKYWQVLSVKNSSAQFAQYETYLYGDHLVSNVLNLDNGDYSAPILVYPYTTTIYLCFTYGTATSIVCSTTSFPSSGYYNKPSDENNLAFITWADNVS